MRRKTFGAGLIAIFCVWTLAYADGKITKFNLEPGYNKVVVKWEVQNETGVRGYEIQRGLNNHDFSKLDFVKAKAFSQPIKKYEYIDKTVFKTGISSRVFYYRLKIVKLDGSFTYSKVEHVSPTVSGARQTWGMIKAMFR